MEGLWLAVEGAVASPTIGLPGWHFNIIKKQLATRNNKTMQLELKMAIMRMASKAAALAALWLTIKPFHIFIGSRCVATMFRPHQPTLDPPSKTNKKQKNNHQRNS